MRTRQKATDGQAAVDVKNLSYSIHSRKILDQISLSVRKNQFVGLIGPNGSGKTTLLKHVYRALPPDKNTVFVHGRQIENYSYKESAREVTILRQENGSDFPYTIMEMVLMGRSPHRKFFEGDTSDDKKLAMEALESVNMSQAAHRSFATLSGGEKQRVLIARSLVQGADILLLDEPTNHLDVHYQWHLMETIRNLNKTVLAVFHELNLACAFCDCLYILHNCRIVAWGHPSEICTKELLADVFRIDADIVPDEHGIARILYRRAL
ncbi:iron complex transport system ATP-binding protein [Desulfitobacterium sp. LBE]|uniref:ABC transporter ATP-binding protein n=1 Tax=Desulfitobacterium sp. LBE TaxID=884086 RepID=UPI00119B043F|nr:ABC transporter ATP-binding protein [Desulfitobacterium sp. LBE]TWH56693.1 iron complex transport system ATP-binding protein [Desulfitobacterium sp. LBE]